MIEILFFIINYYNYDIIYYLNKRKFNHLDNKPYMRKRSEKEKL